MHISLKFGKYNQLPTSQSLLYGLYFFRVQRERKLIYHIYFNLLIFS